MQERIQTSKTPVVFVRLPKKVYDAIRKEAKADDRTISYVLRQIVERHVEDNGKRG